MVTTGRGEERRGKRGGGEEKRRRAREGERSREWICMGRARGLEYMYGRRSLCPQFVMKLAQSLLTRKPARHGLLFRFFFLFFSSLGILYLAAF
jgi:hypothetical protein